MNFKLAIENSCNILTGIDAMGLFWSMQPEPGFETKRFMKDNVSTPLLSTVNVYSGLRTLNEIQNGKVRLIFTSEVPRWYKAPNVKKIEIERGRIRGTLFIPSGKDVRNAYIHILLLVYIHTYH